jgi:UDP-glucose 4-epimerase
VVCAEVKIVHYDPKKFDFGKKKAFPMRPQHFFTGVDKAMKVQDTSHASHS